MMVDGYLFNSDLSRFAIVPHADYEDASLAKEVNEIIGAFSQASERDHKAVTIETLLELHSWGRLLWPITSLFGLSAIGCINTNQFINVLAEVDSDLVNLRSFFEHAEDSVYADWSEVERQKYALSTWRLFACVRYATTEQIDDPEDLRPVHLNALLGVIRPDGVWLDGLSDWHRKSIKYSVETLLKKWSPGDTELSLIRTVWPLTRSPRNPNTYFSFPELKWLDEGYESWLDNVSALSKRGRRRGKRLLETFFSTLPTECTKTPANAFARKNMKQMLEFALEWSTPSSRILALGQARDFSHWLAGQTQGEDGEPTFESGLTDVDVKSFSRRTIVPIQRPKGAEVAARPMPMRYHLRLKDLIMENDFAWAKSLMDKFDKKPIHFISWFNADSGNYEQIFCPVIPRMLLCQLDLPLRNIQVRRLDSGEGDPERWNPRTKDWEKNPSSLARYWERSGAKKVRRGVICRLDAANNNNLTGFWINSNKTQDRATLFDETSGYEIPWEHLDALQNLAAMREWQEKYNPVTRPVAHADVPEGIFLDEPSEVVKASLPDRFYLFRYPNNPGPRGKEVPPTYNLFQQFFYDALDELERRINAEDPDHPVQIITKRDHSGNPKKAIFTPHGMRSATLTGLHLSGVPIEVLSKLVAGHASILMTLKYVKFDPRHVSQVLSDARLRMDAHAREEFPNFLSRISFEQAVKLTARLSDDGVMQAKSGSFTEPAAWSRLEIGICPNGATLCHLGGRVLQKRNSKGTDKSNYAPVSGGARNCVQCRFFVTGLAFLIPLWASASALTAKADACARKAADMERDVTAMKVERLNLNSQGEPVPLGLRDKIAIGEEAWLTALEQRDALLADLHATMSIIEKVRAIGSSWKHNGDSSIPMLYEGDELPEIVGRVSTRFEVADAVVQASRFYPSLRSPELEQERDEFLNQILYSNGYVPITMAPLSAEEKKRAADAMAAVILIEIGAHETQALIEGRKTLADLGMQERFESACRRAIGPPFAKVAPLLPSTSIDLPPAAE
jgi:hypothetical protein